MFGELTRTAADRIDVNAAFNEAVVYFRDGSHLRFRHASRDDRWAHASASDTTADKVCQSLEQFRLNAKHLQMFFSDGSDAEFAMAVRGDSDNG